MIKRINTDYKSTIKNTEFIIGKHADFIDLSILISEIYGICVPIFENIRVNPFNQTNPCPYFIVWRYACKQQRGLTETTSIETLVL